MDNILDIAKKVLKTEAEAIFALMERLGNNFEKAVESIYECKGRVVVTGMGKSGLVGKKIAATLASTGTPAFFLHSAEAGHGDLGMVTSRDVLLAISNSGETEEIVGLIPFLKRFNLRLISITGNPNSTLSRAADVTLDVSVKEEACPFGIVPTASTTATMAAPSTYRVIFCFRKPERWAGPASFGCRPAAAMPPPRLPSPQTCAAFTRPTVLPSNPAIGTPLTNWLRRCWVAELALSPTCWRVWL